MTVSATQIEKGRDCLRRWLFDWNTPFSERPEKGQAALDGSALHKVGEDYHVRGVAPDRHTRYGQMFYPALAYVPRPLIGRAEGEFQLTASGITYTGAIDLECRSDDLPKATAGGLPAVIDYKGKPNLKHPSILEGPGDFYDNPQALIYAARTLVRCQADAVYMRWIYIKREGPAGARASDCVMTRKETSEAFGRIVHPTARVLVQLKKKRDLNPLTLPPNPASCLRYGVKFPCPHINKCNLTPEQKLLGLEEQRPTEEMMNSLLAMLEELPDNTKAVEAASPPAALREPGINPPEASQAVQQTRSTVASKVAMAEALFSGASAEQKAEAVEKLLPTEKRALSELSDEELGRALRTLVNFVLGR